MSEILKELKTTERDLRQLVNDVYQTTYNCGNVYIQRLSDFFKENIHISKLLDGYTAVEDISEFYINLGASKSFDIPKDKVLHISLILGMIDKLYQQNDLMSFFVLYKGHKKYNDSIQDGLRDLLNPLYIFLSTRLREQIEEIENTAKKLPSIGGDYVAGNKNQADIIAMDKSKVAKKMNVAFYKKEGFVGGVIAGIISGLAVWGITELIKFLIGR